VLWLDHVIYATDDLDAEAERWRRASGLASVEGGRHARWGTANRIVPLGEDYVEIAAVVDAEQARGNVFGRAILERTGRWLGVVVATDELDAVASRLGLDVGQGSRVRPDGTELRWRSAGFDDPRREWWMPFFIEWNVPPELHPGRADVHHGRAVRGIASVEIAGDGERLRSWTGEADLPFVVVDGPGEIRGVTLAADDGVLEIP
jgi:Glyoxalase-like domain